MVHLSQFSLLLLPLPLGFLLGLHTPILLGLLICQPLPLLLLLGFCGPSHLRFSVKLDQTCIHACKLHLHIFCLLDNLVGLLIGLWMEQGCQFRGHGGGQEEKRYSLFKSRTTFYPLAPLVATLEDTAKISHSLSLAPRICPPCFTFDCVNHRIHLGSWGEILEEGILLCSIIPEIILTNPNHSRHYGTQHNDFDS